MENEVDGVIVSPKGHTGHIQLDGYYNYIDGTMFEFKTLDNVTVKKRHLDRKEWFLLSYKPLVAWSEE